MGESESLSDRYSKNNQLTLINIISIFIMSESSTRVFPNQNRDLFFLKPIAGSCLYS